MRTKIVFFGLFLLAGLIFTSSCQKEEVFDEGTGSSVVLKSGRLPLVSGQGTFLSWKEYEDYPEGIKRTFSFHAGIMPDGSVKGSGVLHYIGGEADIKFDITCMTITGNRVKLSGFFTLVSLDPPLVGKPCFFIIEDNGEKAGDNPDRISELDWVDAEQVDCAEKSDEMEMWPIDRGNIQVKP